MPLSRLFKSVTITQLQNYAGREVFYVTSTERHFGMYFFYFTKHLFSNYIVFSMHLNQQYLNTQHISIDMHTTNTAGV